MENMEFTTTHETLSYFFETQSYKTKKKHNLKFNVNDFSVMSLTVSYTVNIHYY